MDWIKIITYEDKPNYYKGVIIFANGKRYYDWHRLNDGDDDYYCTLNSNLVIEGDIVTHWMPLPEPPK